MNWIKLENYEEQLDQDELDSSPLRLRVEPWLSSLFQSEHLSLLLGSGFTTAVSKLADTDAPGMATTDRFGQYQPNIDERAQQTAGAMGRGEANIEDQLRAAMELQTGLTILGESAQAATLGDAINSILQELVEGVLRAEAGIAAAIEGEDEDGADLKRILQLFLLSVSSRSASRDRLSLFTTNYDRVIEFGCDLTGLWILDRFVGTLSPEFRSSRIDLDLHYNPPGIRGEPRYVEGVVRLTKLHGSIDWMRRSKRLIRAPLAFGASGTPWNDPAESLMIFPNSAKDIETAAFPYAELFRDMSASVCKPNSCLITYGYGFGDDHVNRVIRDMLSIPSTHLVVMSYDDPGDRIQTFVSSTAHPTQVTLLVGPHIADLRNLVDRYLPRPAIDVIIQRQVGLQIRRGHREEQPGDDREAQANDVAD